MSIITIIIVLVVAGIILYLINNYLPIDQKIKTLINWVVVIVLIIWLIKVFGLLAPLNSIKV